MPIPVQKNEIFNIPFFSYKGDMIYKSQNFIICPEQWFPNWSVSLPGRQMRP
jgi:hypothetical protein